MANKTTKKKKLVLLDAHAIIHRAYHALPEFTSPTGEPTGALYGVAAMLLKIIKDLKPDYLVACYDLPEKTFRHEAYTGYKATRKEIPQDLIFQLEKSREIFHAFNVPIYDKAGFEADDILGTIAEKLKDNKDVEIIIASGDMDTLQLVREGVKVFTLKKGINDTIIYDEKAVVARFGFAPKYLVDYKGLRGDPSDNILGVSGIGEKTAMILVSKLGSLEEIYEKLKKDEKILVEAGIKKGAIEKLKAEEEEAFFSKTLAQIKTDVPIDFFLSEISWQAGVSLEKIETLFQGLGFKSLAVRLGEVFEKKEARLFELPPDEEVKKIAIALWLLNSKLTNPTTEDILVYGGSDFETAREKILKDIEEAGLDFVYNEIELPLIPIIEKMQRMGVLIDVEFLKKLRDEYRKTLSEIEKKIWQLAGSEFNINSPKQMAEILFEKLEISTKGIRKTSTQKRSTNIKELTKLRDLHPIISEIMNYRETSKILFTYLEALPKLIDEENRIHAKFIQTGTTTGRFSSEEPNLQNVPIRGEGKEIRKVFIAPEGYALVAFDYSQIELRAAALLSQDKNLIKIFKEGLDVHNSVAAKVFGVAEDKVTPDMRRRAKVINFGIIYGMGISALKASLGTTEAEAQKFYDEYLAAFPGLAKYLQETKITAFNLGYTKTLFGRRRYFPELKSKIPYIKGEAERMAINAPIQGTATADIIKLAMKKLDKILENFDAKLILQVHDELVLEIKNEEVSRLIPLIKEAMEDAIPALFLKGMESVPLLVSIKQGENWGELA